MRHFVHRRKYIAQRQHSPALMFCLTKGATTMAPTPASHGSPPRRQVRPPTPPGANMTCGTCRVDRVTRRSKADQRGWRCKSRVSRDDMLKGGTRCSCLTCAAGMWINRLAHLPCSRQLRTLHHSATGQCSGCTPTVCRGSCSRALWRMRAARGRPCRRTSRYSVGAEGATCMQRLIGGLPLLLTYLLNWRSCESY